MGGRLWLMVILLLGQAAGWPSAPVATEPPMAMAETIAQQVATAEAMPSDRDLLFGVAGHAWWLDDHLETFLAAYRDLGVTTVRLSIDWKVIEATPGVYRWDRYDRVLRRLADERLTLVGVFVTVPPWASSDPAGCGVETSETTACNLLPEHLPAFERVARAMLTRYPFIRYWEFWNEPELWTHLGRDMADYYPLLTRFYAIAKEVDPSLQVAAATVAGWDYVGWLYDVADHVHGPANRPWDAIAFHPYNTHAQRDAAGAVLTMRYAEVRRLRDEMVARGDGHKPLWITEYGWDTEPAEQAASLREGLRWLLRQDYIAMAHVHMLHDWEFEEYGLMRTVPNVYLRQPVEPTTRFEPKEPYYSAFRTFQRPALPPGEAGQFSPTTGQALAPVFAAAWAAVPAPGLGVPLTRPFWERQASGAYALVQYCERGRLEWSRADGVQFGLLGDEALQRRGWLNDASQPTYPATQPAPPPADDTARYFPETGQALTGPFLAAWEAAGGMPVLGFPRTAVLSEDLPGGGVLLVQYTQRGRLEQITGGAEDGQVRLARLGVSALQDRGWLTADEQPAPISLNPARRAFQ